MGCLLATSGPSSAQDWAGLRRYEEENRMIGPPAADEARVVFMGDSITEGWGELMPEFFAGKPYVNRGICGQTSPQMFARFRADIIALQPKVVVILAGTNDLLRAYADAQGLVYLDYFGAMVDDRNGLPAALSPDGVHPNRAGYEVMAPLAEEAIRAVMGR